MSTTTTTTTTTTAGAAVAPAVVTATAYPPVFVHLARAGIDLLTADVRVMLVTDAYTPADTDEFLAAVARYETAGTGYVAGGAALVNRDVALVAGRAVLSCDPVMYTAAGFLARYAVVFAATGDPASSVLICRVDFGASVDPSGDDLRLAFPDGVIRLGPVP